jgi:hypothetical protein
VSTSEELHREALYRSLINEFLEVGVAIGGWESEVGSYLDGKLWALAETLRVAGVQDLTRARLRSEVKT